MNKRDHLDRPSAASRDDTGCHLARRRAWPRPWLLLAVFCCGAFGSSTAGADDEPPTDTAAPSVSSPTADQLVEQAIKLDDADKDAEALKLLEQAIRLNPKHARAHLFRGRMKRYLGDPHGALRDMLRAKELGEKSARLYCERASALLDLSLHQKALQATDKALALQPKSAWTRNLRGLAKAGLKDQQGAIEEYTLGMKDDESYVWLYLNRGNVFFSSGRLRPAMQDYDKVLALRPNDPLAHHNLGLCHYEFREFDKALVHFDRAIELNPKYADAYGNRGVLKLDRRQLFPAIADFDKCLELNPKASRFYLKRAIAKHTMRDRNGAYPDTVKYIELRPDDAKGYALRGLILMQARRHTDAIADFTQALERDPQHEGSLLYRARSLETMGDHQAAMSDLNALLKIADRTSDGWYDRALLKWTLKDYRGAIADLDVLTKSRPDYAMPYLLRAHSWIALKNFDQAKADLKKMLTMDLRSIWVHPGIPGRCRVEHLLGVVYFKGEKNTAQALKHFDAAIQIHPRDGAPWTYRAAVKKSLKDYAGAVSDLNRSIEIDPRRASLYVNRGDIKILQKNTAGAILDYDKAIELSPGWGRAYFQRSLAKEQSGDYEGARSDYGAAIQYVAGDEQSKFARRRIAKIDRGDTSGFQNDRNELLRTDPDAPFDFLVRSDDSAKAGEGASMDFDSLKRRARYRYEKKDYQAALQDVAAAIKLRPQESFLYRWRGLAEAELAQYDDALASFSRAIEIDPENADAYSNRSQWRKQVGDLERAEKDARKCIELDKQAVYPFVYLGDIRCLQGKHNDAISHYDKAIAADSSLAWPRYSRATWLLDQGQEEEAGAELLQVLTKNDRITADFACLRLWLIDVEKQGRSEADKALRKHFEAKQWGPQKDWAPHIAKFLLGELNEAELLDQARRIDDDKRRVCQCSAYYYIARVRKIAAEHAKEREAYRQCLATGERNSRDYLSAAFHLKHVEPARPASGN